jgi:signal transduction histidine kinase/ligand-binding sensor domain-containing protein
MKCVVAWVIGLVLCGQAWPVSTDLTLQQLNHRSWSVVDGAPGGVEGFAQTSDGTLWVGTLQGLFRFDGLRFVSYPSPSQKPLQGNGISTLTASADGSLWIGFRFGGAAVLKGDHLVGYSERDGLPIGTVKHILVDQDGSVWLAALGGLARLNGSRWQRIVFDPTNPGAGALATLVDRAGTFWVMSEERVLARPAGSSSFREVVRRTDVGVPNEYSLSQGPNGSIWAASVVQGGALVRLDAGTGMQTNASRWVPTAEATALMFDQDGNLWFGDRGVSRIPASLLATTLDNKQVAEHAEAYTVAQGLTANARSLFEDREHNIWVGTPNGIDRFSQSNVIRIIHANMNQPAALLPIDKGGVLAVTNNLNHESVLLEIRDSIVAKEYPAPYITNAYRETNGAVWFGGPSGLMRFDNGRFETTPLPAAAAASRVPVLAIVRDREGPLWISLAGKGLSRVIGDKWVLYGDLPALPRTHALIAAADTDGNLWFGYSGNRIARVDGTNVRIFGSAEGLDVGNVTAITPSQKKSNMWIGGDRGLFRFDGTRFTEIRGAAGISLAGIAGIIETATQDLWLNGVAGISHVTRQEIEHSKTDAAYGVQTETFNYLDGVPGPAVQVRPTPSAVEGTDGRLWFALQGGVVSIDPSHIKRNTLPPPVTIWSISSGGLEYAPLAMTRLPIHTNNVRIGYTAGSLTVPERIRFRYKLEGFDQAWQDAGDRREAAYTNLGPGRYTFRVIAANNDGVWNNSGASLLFTIAPAFYQTQWFHELCTAACLALLWMLYRLRIRQVSAQVRGRLQERVVERERIARELHDTLLQSVQGLVLRFRVAVTSLSNQDPVRSMMEHTLDRADEVLAEGRDRVKDLRSSSTSDLDLCRELATLGEELSKQQATPFGMTIEGSSRDLHPIVREEAMFIAREALTNAFRHASAQRIEAEVLYSNAELRVRIRDDGGGIDSAVMQQGGRPGHWGLLGMRERAAKIRATITIWSKAGVGTEIALSVPAHIAYRRRRKIYMPWQRPTISDEPT